MQIFSLQATAVDRCVLFVHFLSNIRKCHEINRPSRPLMCSIFNFKKDVLKNETFFLKVLLIQHIAWPSGLSSSWWGDPPLSDKRRLLKSHQVCLSVRINELSSTQLSTWRIRMPVMILQLWSYIVFIIFMIMAW